MKLNGKQVEEVVRIDLDDIIWDVKQAPDGSICYVLTDKGDGMCGD